MRRIPSKRHSWHLSEKGVEVGAGRPFAVAFRIAHCGLLAARCGLLAGGLTPPRARPRRARKAKPDSGPSFE